MISDVLRIDFECSEIAPPVGLTCLFDFPKVPNSIHAMVSSIFAQNLGFFFGEVGGGLPLLLPAPSVEGF